MAKVDPCLRKEIVKNLHAAIDSEITNNDREAYQNYIESLRLVAEALKRDVVSDEIHLSVKERQSLIDFAKQSITRVSLILKKEEPSIEIEGQHSSDITPSAPAGETEVKIPTMYPHSIPHFASKDMDEERNLLVSRYYRRLDNASSAVERQNLELELARQLVEKAAITRNRLMQATAWAMQSAHRKFNIDDKLKGGTLKESDFKKQQLYALTLQYTEGNSWLKQYLQDLSIYPNNEKLIREFLDGIFCDNTHPIRCSLQNMQTKIQELIKLEKSTDLITHRNHFVNISNEIKEDFNILQEVLKTLYEVLSIERNSQLTSEVLNHFYFAPVKMPLVGFIRNGTQEMEQAMIRAMQNGCADSCCVELNEDAKKEAITKLHYLGTLHSPYDMIDCSIHIIKLMTTSQFDKQHFTSVGADDLLPRLCEVVVQSKLVALGAEITFMETFMPSEKALGEGGYAVTTLQSVIAHLSANGV